MLLSKRCQAALLLLLHLDCFVFESAQTVDLLRSLHALHPHPAGSRLHMQHHLQLQRTNRSRTSVSRQPDTTFANAHPHSCAHIPWWLSISSSFCGCCGGACTTCSGCGNGACRSGQGRVSLRCSRAKETAKGGHSGGAGTCFKRFSTQLRVVMRLVKEELRVSDAAVRRRPLLLSCDRARRAREKTQSDSAHQMRVACVFACMRAVYLK